MNCEEFTIKVIKNELKINSNQTSIDPQGF
jgi:hypothetical protein